MNKAYDYTKASENEIKRLAVQSKILRGFERPVFRNVFESINAPVILDIGCNNGVNAMGRLADSGYAFYLGTDISASAVDSASENYGNPNTVFRYADASSEDFVPLVQSVLAESGKDKADIIMMSLLLLHLSQPLELLKKLRPLLRKGGIIIIKDIDDRDNCSSYDPDGIFAHAYEIAHRNRGSGNRHTGRQIGNWLTQAGYCDISLRARGLSTDNMTAEQREALFTTYFGFFEEDCEAEAELSQTGADDLLWCKNNLPRIREYILQPDFRFSLGFCIYTASNPS